MEEWIGNIYDPWASDALMQVVRYERETPWEALERIRQMARLHHVGDPQATPYYSVEALKKMGMVGLYKKD